MCSKSRQCHDHDGRPCQAGHGLTGACAVQLPFRVAASWNPGLAYVAFFLERHWKSLAGNAMSDLQLSGVTTTPFWPEASHGSRPGLVSPGNHKCVQANKNTSLHLIVQSDHRSTHTTQQSVRHTKCSSTLPKIGEFCTAITKVLPAGRDTHILFWHHTCLWSVTATVVILLHRTGWQTSPDIQRHTHQASYPIPIHHCHLMMKMVCETSETLPRRCDFSHTGSRKGGHRQH